MSVATALRLPRASGAIEPYTPGAASAAARPPARRARRVAFAAAHVVADPLAAGDPGGPAQLDWEATLAFRRHLWEHGFAVAEAMDTAQRGMGLDWPVSRELIRRSVAEARAVGGPIAARRGHRPPDARRPTWTSRSCARVRGAVRVRRGHRRPGDPDGQPRARRRGAAPEDYAEIYGHVLGALERPAILHWLGPIFDPALAGYWGDDDLDAAGDTLLGDHRRRTSRRSTA